MVRNTLYNLFGFGVPLVVAVFTIPVLIDMLGASGFGILTLIWAVSSYFGLFDLGLGRTLTLQLSAAESRGETWRLAPLAVTALSIMGVLGVALGIGFIVLAEPAVGLLNDVPDHQKAVEAVRAMGWALPAITLTSGFRGISEGRHDFWVVNAVRLPLGVYTFLVPAFVAVFMEPRLDWIAWALVIGRWVACIVHGVLSWRSLPIDKGRGHFAAHELRPLLTIGGWLTVSNIISPLMGYVDRFAIATIATAAAVAYYVTPYEIVTKLWIIPGALTTVMFPIFAAQVAPISRKTTQLYQGCILALSFLLLPICGVLALFSHEILAAWIDSEFANNSSAILQVFVVGVFINSLGQVPFTLIQGAQRPRQTAMLHLLEFFPFVGLLWWLTGLWGIWGTAVAWMVRISLDTILLFAMAHPLLKRDHPRFAAEQAVVIALAVFLAMAAFSPNYMIRGGAVLVVSAVSVVYLLRLRESLRLSVA